MLPTPLAAWNFNKDFGEQEGLYKDSVGGLILASADGLDHPAASPKVGAGAYAANNTLSRRLKCSMIPGLTSLAGASLSLSISIWWRAASTGSAIIDRIVELLLSDTTTVKVSLSYNKSAVQRVKWSNTDYQLVEIPDVAWHHSCLTVSAPYESEGLSVQNWTSYLDNIPVSREVSEWASLFPDEDLALMDLAVCGQGSYWNGDVDALAVFREELTAEQIALLWNNGDGWEYSTQQTIKQHVVVGPTGIIQPVGACSVVPGWV